MWKPQTGGISGAELVELKENLKVDLASLLCSSKEGLTPKELSIEYYELVGSSIPFAKLGYNGIYELMRDLNDVCTIKKHFTGSWVFFPVYDNKTIALGSLVKGQKDDKKGVRNKSRMYEALRKVNYRKTNNAYKPLQSMSNKVNQGLVSDQLGNRQVPIDIQKQIVYILNLAEGYRLSREQFELEYKKNHAFLFNFLKLGFTTLRQVFETLDHIVTVEPDGGEYYVALKQQANRVAEVKANRVANVTPSKTDVSTKVYQSLEEETVENLKEIVKQAGTSGIYLSDVIDVYRAFTGKSIEFEKLGYVNFEQLVNFKLPPLVKIDVDEPHYEPKLFWQDCLEKEVSSAKPGEVDDKEDDPDEIKTRDQAKIRLLKLKELIDDLLEQQTEDKFISLDEFYVQFEKYYGWKLDCTYYGFGTNDEFITEIVQLGFIKIELYHNNLNKLMILCPKKESIQMPVRKLSERIISEPNLENIQKATAEFMQDYILYNQEVKSSCSLQSKLASQRTHRIIISNVSNPCNIQIQLAENVNNLNKLMEDLETVYCGLGASNYNMPSNYIEHGHLCAAIFPTDQNWHRCLITGVLQESQKAKVYFVDYGGECILDINELKFLAAEFSYLPMQAINARFANITEPPNGVWPKDIVNYLLNRVKHKTLWADVCGCNDGFVSLEIYHYIENNNGTMTKVSLNTRLVQDGFGTKYNEKEDVEFYDFESWQKLMLEKSNKTKRDANNNTGSSIQSGSKGPASMADSFNKTREVSIERSTRSVDNSNLDKRKENLSDLRRNKLESMTSKNSAFGDAYDSTLSVFAKTKQETSRSTGLKMKRLTFLDPFFSIKYRLNLVQINTQIYVHWTEVAHIFGCSQYTFKSTLLTLSTKPKSRHDIYENFKLASDTEDLFNIIENEFDIDLKSIDETETLWMVKYKLLYSCAEIFLSKDHSERMKNFLRNNKVSKDCPNMPEGFYSAIEKLTMDDVHVTPEQVAIERDRLKPLSIYLKSEIQKCVETDVKGCEKLMEEFKVVKKKIEFYDAYIVELEKQN